MIYIQQLLNLVLLNLVLYYSTDSRLTIQWTHQCIYYSLTSINDTIGHKNFSFCEQTLHKGLIDASCNWLQSTRKNRGQNIFLRKLRAKIQFLRLLFSSLRSISSYNPHTILKNARRGRLKIYIYFYLQKLQVGPGDAACRELQYATKNMARTNFLRKI